ncbi:MULTISPECIES: peptidase T [unclassified Aureispira]|uniref:peptidase T n=1 Tax=unclassified Aureispira TaxID=2649989 RepID=UPI000698DA81|nr:MULTISPECIES: peptidase T [unclassified Aureispira]WMX16987.1 peptidase T [Aureispira sp. CCB-E]
MKEQILDRFLRYVKVDTQSEFGVEKIPSTDKQFILANQIVEELKAIGLSDVEIDDHCYIMATLPANTDKKIPTVGFVAHIDTSPDFTATGCAPIVWNNYDGGDLVLNEKEDLVLRTSEFPEMLQFKGQTLITTDGMTLLGADDKAGVTEIVSAMEYLINHPEIKHGKIRICFTPDEEVGRGADLFDVEKFGAEWAYTMDGSLPGEIEYENFNAAYAAIDIQGKIVHPGAAKDKMVNSMYIAAELIQALPAEEVPEKTEGYEGFFHLLSVNGDVDKTELRYIIRDHDKEKFEAKKALMQQTVDALNQKYDHRLSLSLSDQYYNMAEKVRPVMHIVDLAREAISNLGMQPITRPIRGGTDGSRLSFMGLPCPNIFAGGLNFHSRYEYVPLESIVAATETIIEIAKLMESRDW